MIFNRIARIAAPTIGLVALAACGNMDVKFDDDFDGVPLAELDMTGDAPTGITIANGDSVVITTGDSFSVDVEGSDEARDRMRFEMEDGVLKIGREDGNWNDRNIATVNIVMPAPSALVIGGAGTITAEDLSGDEASIVIGGSGTVSIGQVDAGDLEIVIGGSGDIVAAGSADRLDLNIGGNGTADMGDLTVGNASINIGGSGEASFASDGNVEANIGGSGTVRVRGSATCEINSFGSGELICETGEEASGA